MKGTALYRAVALPWRYGRSLQQSLVNRALFRDVETYCQFVGYPRSGHTLVYAMLNAHPDVVLSNELGALQWLRLGFSRGQIYSMILRNDRGFASRGFKFQGYEYHVPGQWQGRFRTIRVIGDKDGGRDTTRLRRDPRLLDRLQRKVGVPVRLVHVIRNPYDMLATIVRRRSQRGIPTTLEDALVRSRATMETVREVVRRSPEESLLTLRHEDVTTDPTGSLRRLCEHLGVEADEAYLKDCSSIVFPSARKTRETGDWTPALIEQVKTEIIDRCEFLAGYTYEG